MERARAKEIATLPPPKQEIDMVCVCVCERSKSKTNSTYSLNTPTYYKLKIVKIREWNKMIL